MKIGILASAAVALFATAPAYAVATFSQDITSAFVMNATGASADFGNTPLQGSETLVLGRFSFADTYTFNYGGGTASGSATNNRVSVQATLRDIDFDSITFNNVGGLVTNVGGLSVVSFENVEFVSGQQTIVITGRSTGGAAYGGSVQIINSAVVPEPATWGMMVLGFGLVGAGVRSRRRAFVAA